MIINATVFSLGIFVHYIRRCKGPSTWSKFYLLLFIVSKEAGGNYWNVFVITDVPGRHLHALGNNVSFLFQLSHNICTQIMKYNIMLCSALWLKISCFHNTEYSCAHNDQCWSYEYIIVDSICQRNVQFYVKSAFLLSGRGSNVSCWIKC